MVQQQSRIQGHLQYVKRYLHIYKYSDHVVFQVLGAVWKSQTFIVGVLFK